MSKTEAERKVNDVLPDDDALSAFAAGAFGSRKRAAATPKPTQAPAAQEEKTAESTPGPRQAEKPAPASEPTPAPADVPTPATNAEETAPAPAPPTEIAVLRTPPQPAVHRPEPVAAQPKDVSYVDIPELGSAGSRPVQCTVMVAVTTRDRLANYQLAKKMETGREPTNAMVVRRAFLHARKQGLFGKVLHDLYNRQAPADEEDFDDDGLLGEVSGRRAERGRMKDNVQQSFRPSMQELAAYDAFCTAYSFPNRSEFLDALLDEFLPPLPSPGRRNR